MLAVVVPGTGVAADKGVVPGASVAPAKPGLALAKGVARAVAAWGSERQLGAHYEGGSNNMYH